MPLYSVLEGFALLVLKRQHLPEPLAGRSTNAPQVRLEFLGLRLGSHFVFPAGFCPIAASRHS